MNSASSNLETTSDIVEDLPNLHIGWLNIDTPQPRDLASFWEQALGAQRVYEGDGGDAVVLRTQNGYRLFFYRVLDEKTVKNRLHLDLVPEDRDAEVARLEALGARRVNVGQDEAEVTWVVLADPDGNEFCVLRPGADSNL